MSEEDFLWAHSLVDKHISIDNQPNLQSNKAVKDQTD
jgi:hypothetical protein